MRHRLTDFDLAVLAALQIGVIRGKRIDRSTVQYTMNGVNIWPSLHRLEQAGEVYVAPNQEVLVAGSPAHIKAAERKDLINELRRAVRRGEIKIIVEKPKKGT